MSFKTVFNIDWTDTNRNPQWAKWIQAVPNDPYKARCRLCSKTFSLSNMGRQAITSHGQSAKHKKMICNSKQTTVIDCFKSNSADIKKVENNGNKSNDLSKFLSKETVLTAEVLWAMKLVISHTSYNSFKDAADLFKIMFTDSDIAKKITIGSSKMAYVITFGLAPYFHKRLIKEIANNDFVICIDEALNVISQKGQMDFLIRYWPENSHEIKVRYFNSVFLGHATAENIYEAFCQGIDELDLKHLLQISLDGPNVNLKFLRFIKDEIKENKDHSLLDIGTCSLHVLHGAFQRGNNKSNWKLNDTFSSMYRIFKNSPARRADFISITNSCVFPLKFCHIRWIENVNVAERAIEVFPNVQKYLVAVKKNLPNNITIGNLEEACNDKLTLSKMAFFCSVANILHPFLKLYQSPKPMVPFMYESLNEILRQIMSRFIKIQLVNDAKTLTKLCQIDVTLSSNHRRLSELDIGIGTRNFLSRSGASDGEKNNFLLQCKIFFTEMCSKILEKLSVNFPIIRALSCLNPNLIVSNALICQRRMDSLLQLLVENNNVIASTADQVKAQFNAFSNIIQVENKDCFTKFCKFNDRLDFLFSSFLKNKYEFKEFFKIVKLVLILAHGNASVESGFSINKDILVENLKEKSLVAIRTTYDAIKIQGGVTSVKIDAEMLQQVKMARNSYHIALVERKKEEGVSKKLVNEKKRIKDQIKLLKQKKTKLSSEVALVAQKLDEEIYELEKKI